MNPTNPQTVLISPHPCSPINAPQVPKWTSLFKSLPCNVGDYAPRSFDSVEVDGVLFPPSEAIQAGEDYWVDYLVGFFLYSNPTYHIVREHCKNRWKLKGGLQVQFDNSTFFFKFSIRVERPCVLEAEPTFMEGKHLIITSWSKTIDSARDQVLSIPVWAHFSHILSVLQSLLGLNWIASLVGDFQCFDSNTVAKGRIVYATN